MILPIVFLIAGLLFFLNISADGPVSRARVPAVGPAPGVPSGAAGDAAGGEDARGDGERGPSTVEIGLTSGEREPLRDRLGQIAQDYPGIYGVVVSDPSSGQSVSMDPDRRFVAASLNKLPVLMTLYKAAAAGEVDLNDEISMRASDVQAYGTGSLFTHPVGYTITLRECAAFLIKESDNTAWKMLDRYLGRSYIRSELYNVGATSTEYWLPNTTTPNDVLLMLEKISDPSYTSPEHSAEMLDLMTNTDFEDRLPQSLPQGARVSHKIGSYGSTFGDAGMVRPRDSRGTEDAYFIVVLATETGEGTARAAMQEMSLATYRTLTETRQVPGDGRKRGP